MKLDSKYFDSIRVGGKRQRSAPDTKSRTAAERDAHAPTCQWKGCEKRGTHRAPAGRGRDGEYFFFCVDHVREYNQNYNYFDGMSDAEVAKFQRDSITGHRPTWKMGANSGAGDTEGGVAGRADQAVNGTAHDPHGFFAWRAKQARQKASERRRRLKPLEKKSLAALMLPETATKDEIKAKFKALVKQHHPDMNGGDRRSEDKLREIIQAYNFLKQAGLV